MREDRELAYKLRLQGNSYSQINQILGVPKSTLSAWFARLELSDSVRDKINQRGRTVAIAALVRRNKNQTTKAIERTRRFRQEARSEIPVPSNNELRLLGISLYWAEGYKRPKQRNGREITSHGVSLTNSDPALVKVFLRFLREVCLVPEEKIKANLRIFSHQNESQLLAFWIGATKLPRKNFTKTLHTISISSRRRRPYNTLPYGVIQIRVANTELFHKIMGWIEALQHFG